MGGKLPLDPAALGRDVAQMLARPSVVAMLLFAASCNNDVPRNDAAHTRRLWVCLRSTPSGQFLADIEAILKVADLNPSRGRAVDDHGHVNNIIQGESPHTNVWVMNWSINNESAPEPVVPDPNTFYVAVSPTDAQFRATSDKTFESLRSRLAGAGYRITLSEDGCRKQANL